MDREEVIKKMAEDIAEATVGGAASSKSLAIALYDANYRLPAPVPEKLREEVAQLIAENAVTPYHGANAILSLLQSAQVEAVKAEREVSKLPPK